MSTASLVVGVAAASANQVTLLNVGVAGLVAGAMSVAAREYVSASSQADTELADLQAEWLALNYDPEAEHEKLAQIYAGRGMEIELARRVSTQLMEHDALAAHARDEHGITAVVRSRPVKAAVALLPTSTQCRWSHLLR